MRTVNKLLVVGILDSPHLGKWLLAMTELPIHIYVFPSTPNNHYSSQLEEVKDKSMSGSSHSRINFPPWALGLTRFIFLLDLLLWKQLLPLCLAAYIRKNKFNAVHLVELQHAGYLYLRALKYLPKHLIKHVIVSNYGSDIFFFKTRKFHNKKITRLLDLATAYTAECHRDIQLAKQVGLKTDILMVVPNSCGINIQESVALPTRETLSGKYIISVKGYQGKFGLAVPVLREIAKHDNLLRNREVHIFSCSLITKFFAHLFLGYKKVKFKCYPKRSLSFAQMMQLFTDSVAYIGMSRSDGISTAMLEAMHCGAIPVQSETSCAKEWFRDGETGVLIKNFEVSVALAHLNEILEDENKQAQAVFVNRLTIKSKYNYETNEELISAFYKRVLFES